MATLGNPSALDSRLCRGYPTSPLIIRTGRLDASQADRHGRGRVATHLTVERLATSGPGELEVRLRGRRDCDAEYVPVRCHVPVGSGSCSQHGPTSGPS